MIKELLVILIMLLFSAAGIAQKTADEYLNDAPITLNKEACSYLKADCNQFADKLKSYCGSLNEDIEQREKVAVKNDLFGEKYKEAGDLIEKITKVTTNYAGEYYCLSTLCSDLPELLSGAEILILSEYLKKINSLVQFRMDVNLGKAKVSENPDWNKELVEAEDAYCSLISPKYKTVLENNLADVKKLLPDYRLLGSLIYSGGADIREIEALTAVYGYLETYLTCRFAGNIKQVF